MTVQSLLGILSLPPLTPHSCSHALSFKVNLKKLKKIRVPYGFTELSSADMLLAHVHVSLSFLSYLELLCVCVCVCVCLSVYPCCSRL